MEIIYANNIFILAILVMLFDLYFKNKIFLLLSVFLLIIYVIIILKIEINLINVIYSIILITFLLFFVKKTLF